MPPSRDSVVGAGEHPGKLGILQDPARRRDAADIRLSACPAHHSTIRQQIR